MAGFAAQGSKLQVKISGAYVTVNGFKSFSGIGGGSQTIIDSSDLNSTAKEKVPGLLDEGSIKVTCNYLPSDAAQTALESAHTSGVLTPVQFVLSNTTTIYSANVIVTGWEKSVGVDALTQVSGTFEISGLVTRVG